MSFKRDDSCRPPCIFYAGILLSHAAISVTSLSYSTRSMSDRRSRLLSVVSMHVDLSKARRGRLAVARPKLSGRRSCSTVFNQVCLGLSIIRCVASLQEDPKCRPAELQNSLDLCRHDKEVSSHQNEIPSERKPFSI